MEEMAFLDFCRRLMSPDGVLVMRMLANHAGELITTDIIGQLWQNHLWGHF
jgi:hypothetical protein